MKRHLALLLLVPFALGGAPLGLPARITGTVMQDIDSGYLVQATIRQERVVSSGVVTQTNGAKVVYVSRRATTNNASIVLCGMPGQFITGDKIDCIGVRVSTDTVRRRTLAVYQFRGWVNTNAPAIRK